MSYPFLHQDVVAFPGDERILGDPGDAAPHPEQRYIPGLSFVAARRKLFARSAVMCSYFHGPNLGQGPNRGHQ